MRSCAGARPYMEDRHTIIADYMLAGPADDAVPRSYAAVFDGHNGVDSAEHASSRCCQPWSIMEPLALLTTVSAVTVPSCCRLHQHLAAEKGVGTCRGVPGSAAAEAEAELMRTALENSFIRTDNEILDRARREDGRDGACALVAVRIGGLLGCKSALRYLATC